MTNLNSYLLNIDEENIKYDSTLDEYLTTFTITKEGQIYGSGLYVVANEDVESFGTLVPHNKFAQEYLSEYYFEYDFEEIKETTSRMLNNLGDPLERFSWVRLFNLHNILDLGYGLYTDF